MIYKKILLSFVPFCLLAADSSPTSDQLLSGVDGVLKWGELGLCLVLVAYLMWSNYSLVNSLQKIVKEKTLQEERLISALHAFCNVCHERPCLLSASAFNPASVSAIINNPAKQAIRQESINDNTDM